MTSTRGSWVRTLLAGLGVLVAPAGASTVWAQGFGPDPFRPYNAQYDPYTYPMGAAAPEAGGAVPGAGIRGANQYQAYLEHLMGAEREANEKYGIGLPYYRAAIDPRFDPQGKREYRPNRTADKSFEQTQELVTQKYFAYFTEKDPKRRAMLLRDYNLMRQKVSRALSTRREDPTRILDAAIRTGLAAKRTAAADRLDEADAAIDTKPRSSSTDRSDFPSLRARPSDTTRAGSSRSIPPPPPLFPREFNRGASARRSPTEVLNRARRLNSGTAPATGARSPSVTAPRSTTDAPAPE